MNKLESLMNAVNLREVIGAETKERIEQTVNNLTQPETVNLDDFESAPIVSTQQEEPYDAEKQARNLVNGLLVLDTAILNPIGMLKIRNNTGGSAVIKKMRKAYMKKMSGAELNDEEKNLYESFETFRNDLNMLSDELIPTDAHRKALMQVAIPYCEDTKINIKSGLVFWGMYTGSLVQKITKILIK
jgi:hypothetical protein